jgi:hypothetical protein
VTPWVWVGGSAVALLLLVGVAFFLIQGAWGRSSKLANDDARNASSKVANDDARDASSKAANDGARIAKVIVHYFLSIAKARDNRITDAKRERLLKSAAETLARETDQLGTITLVSKVEDVKSVKSFHGTVQWGITVATPRELGYLVKLGQCNIGCGAWVSGDEARMMEIGKGDPVIIKGTIAYHSGLISLDTESCVSIIVRPMTDGVHELGGWHTLAVPRKGATCQIGSSIWAVETLLP